MVEYVYAIHDFAPENADEISFKAGEQIEVVEKDDLYGDGWWQGKVSTSKVGLFPVAYTTKEPPAPVIPEIVRQSSSGGPLQSLREETDSMNEPEPDGTVMAATLTDVQAAIEQLGTKRIDGDAASHTFSFSSARDGTDVDADHEHNGDNDTWTSNPRSLLAQNAMDMEKARNLERSVAPPIEVELSDESDDEDDEHHHHRHHSPNHLHPGSSNGYRPYGRIEDPARHSSPTLPAPSAQDVIDHDKELYRLSTVSSSQLIHHASDTEGEGEADTESLMDHPIKLAPAVATLPRAPTPTTPKEPTPMAHPVPQPVRVSTPTLLSNRTSQPLPSPTASYFNAGFAAAIPLPMSPAPLLSPIITTPKRSSTPTAYPEAKTVVASPAATIVHAPALVPTPMSTIATPLPAETHSQPPSNDFKGTTPNEWTVDQVVSWLRSKNFDDGVCAKFIEHEITGDVLLELDVNLLKELDIAAFGKRMRISNAIADLRRPASFISSTASYPPTSAQPGDSGRQSLLNSPAPFILSPESAPHTGDIPGTPYYSAPVRRESDPGTTVPEESNGQLKGLGYTSLGGITVATTASDKGTFERKSRPVSLALSPSDSALHSRHQSQKASMNDSPGLIQEEDEQVLDERAVMSEGEAPKRPEERAKKRKVFGRSPGTPASVRSFTESQQSPSADISTPMSSAPPSTKRDSNDTHGTSNGHKSKKSLDVGKPSESRLSFLGGSLGVKSRKPPPRYSAVEGSDTSPTLPPPEKANRSLSRLYLGGSVRRPNRPSTATSNSVKSAATSPKSSTDPTVLRKRTVSASDIRLEGPSNGVTLLPGVNALQQIGKADYEGWLRKKGENYNSWKLRYLVLKGHHLYYLKSKAETKIKGYINILGYKVIVDENVNPGRYGFRIVHDHDRTHLFSSDEQLVVREWMKSLMKATIGRDYTQPVISSCNIPTIPLAVAQAMSPAPRPPSPTARDATQRALRRENPNKLSSRDARVLMGLPSPDDIDPDERKRFDSAFAGGSLRNTPTTPTPQRPPRELRRPSVSSQVVSYGDDSTADLINWLNSHLHENSRPATDLSTSLATGLILFRVAEAIKGKPSEVLDSDFPNAPGDEKLEGLFKLFDFLLDNDVRMGSVSINDVRQGNEEKITQLVRSLKSWEEKRRKVESNISRQVVAAGPWLGVS